MEIIRNNFLEIDKDSSGDIDVEEQIIKGKEMLDKDEFELREK